MAGRFVNAGEQFFDNSGNILALGTVSFFSSGTVVLKTVFADQEATTPITNPVVLDGAGRIPNIYLDGSYKTIVKDAAGNQIEERDPVSSPDITIKGFSTWNAVSIYSILDIVIASNNLLYQSLISSNQNQNPTTAATAWIQIEFVEHYNTNKTYVVGNFVIASNNQAYVSQIGSNVGNEPSIDTGANWLPDGTNALMWVTTRTYAINDNVFGSDGEPYASNVASNTGNDPTTDTSGNWRQVSVSPVIAAASKIFAYQNF